MYWDNLGDQSIEQIVQIRDVVSQLIGGAHSEEHTAAVAELNAELATRTVQCWECSGTIPYTEAMRHKYIYLCSHCTGEDAEVDHAIEVAEANRE